MPGPICSVLRSVGFPGIIPGRTAIQGPQAVKTQLDSLPPITQVLSPLEKMGSGAREQVLALANATGNPFWAREAIRQASETSYPQAV